VNHGTRGKDGRIRGAWDLAHDSGQLVATGKHSLRWHLIDAGAVQTSASVTAYTSLGPRQWRKPGAPKRGYDAAWKGHQAEGTPASSDTEGTPESSSDDATPERRGTGRRLSPRAERALRHEESRRKWEQ
jgi:hypothetical protein